MSQDASGAWVLWDVGTKAILANGACGGSNCFVQAAGSVFAAGISNGVALHALSDGHLVTSITYPSSTNAATSGLATDGSYLWVRTDTAILVYSATGALLFTHAGSYVGAQIFAGPGQLRVGVSTSQTIESIDATSGSSTLSVAFSGTFYAWFQGGAHFFTSAGSTSRIYSSALAQEALLTVAASTLVGTGDYFLSKFTGDQIHATTLNIYAVASPTTPVQTYSQFTDWLLSGNMLAAWVFGSEQSINLITLGASVTSTVVTIPTAETAAFGADGAGNWTLGNSNGVIYDSAHLASGGGPLSCGAAFAISGASTLGVVGTDGAGVLTFTPNAAGISLQGSLPYKASFTQLTADAKTLAVEYPRGTSYPLWPDHAVHVLSLPGDTEIHSFPTTQLTQLSLASGGSMLGRLDKGTATVTSLDGTTTSVSQALTCPFDWPIGPAAFVSPSGTFVAVTDGTCNAAEIYKNGTLVDTATGAPSGWLDDDRLVIQIYKVGSGGSGVYNAGTAIHTVSTSTNSATLTIPCTQGPFGLVDANHVFCPGNQNLNDIPQIQPPQMNAIYDLTTGAVTWTGSENETGVGALVGAFVLYAADHRLYVEAHP